ncbi:MAG: excinuclease ABC subunit UvrC [Micrococcales bacterium]|nr:excinuclease ABC subunit UvrC [Micrococcales bacterium]
MAESSSNWPPSFRPEPGAIPTAPGVYRFFDRDGRVIYVGKAKNLRARLANYFQPLGSLHPRTRTMVTSAAGLEWTTVRTELEALTLEYTWIKEFVPRFNVKYRDDKSYPYLAITISEEFPRAQVMRGTKRKGVKYFGPYGQAWAIRETLDLLTRVFPVRTCSKTVFNRYQVQGRPCLLSYIGKCSAPCVGRVSPENHRQLVEDFIDFLSGQTGRYLASVNQAMAQAAQDQDYERAAKLRDDAAALAKVAEQNALVLPDNTEADIYAMASDELEAAVQVFYIRRGRVTGQRGWIVELVEDIGPGELVSHLLQAAYLDGGGRDLPKEILVPHLPTDAGSLGRWLAEKRGSAVAIRVPKRGDKAKLATTLQQNAEQALSLHRARRASDLTTRSQALKDLAQALDLDQAPLRIECYDISHTQSTNQVGSMVVFEDGLARKAAYRHFTIKGPEGAGARDDTAAMAEVLTRRFSHAPESGADDGPSPGENPSPAAKPQPREKEAVDAKPQPRGKRVAEAPASAEARRPPDAKPQPRGKEAVDAKPQPRGKEAAEAAGAPEQAATTATTKPTRAAFAYPPNLVVVDGGVPQVNAARRAMDQTGAAHVAVIGLAKRLEEVFLPGQPFPVILPRSSEGLFLLQRLRDEAHRFAITAHRAKRSKSMTRSALSEIPGLGPAKQQALLRHFGSLKQIRAAQAADLTQVPGIGPKLAATICHHLRGKIEG